MNPPSWDGPNATVVRDELLRRVAEEGSDAGRSETPDARRRRPRSAARLAVAFGIALALIVPASLFALTHRQPAPAGGGATLSVVTGTRPSAETTETSASMTGTLRASRSGSLACFWITPFGATGPSSRSLLVFVPGYAATTSLQLLDGSGRVVAASGDTVTLTTTRSNVSGPTGRIQGCSTTGAGEIGVLGVRRRPDSTPSASTAAPSRKVASCATDQIRPFTCDAFVVQYPSGDASSFEAWFDVLDGTLRFVVGESERLRSLPLRLAGDTATAAPVPGWPPLQRGCSPDSECALDQAIERIFTGGATIARDGKDLRLTAGAETLIAKGTGRPHRYPQVGIDEVAGRALLTYHDNGTHMDAADLGRLSVNAAGCLTDGSFVLVLPDTTVLDPDGSIDINGRHVPLGGRLHLGGGEGSVPADQRCGTGGYFYGWGA